MIRKSILTLIALSLSAIAFAEVQSGEKAPDFTLTDTEGQTHSLSDFEGKFVVLEWLNHDCPFVVRHYKSGAMPAMQKDFTEKGVVWLSINSTNPDHANYKTPEEANALTASYEAAPTAVLMDESGEVGQAYGAQTTPHMYVIAPDGTLLYQGAFDDDPRGR
ncbi:MAG: redoxin domain-containing protein, partial [Verrucomicrobiota bacterium]